MPSLYYHQICPFSRQVRLLLKEANCDLKLINKEFWQPDTELYALNPSGELPILIEDNEFNIAGNYALIEYIRENYNIENIPTKTSTELVEERRLIEWINRKLYREVTKYLIDEKLVRFTLKAGAPNTNILRVAKNNLKQHLIYFNNLLSEKDFLTGDYISFADFILASQLSVADFFGDIYWDDFLKVKIWYSVIKSRPSFKPILNDRILGFSPPEYYNKLDF